MRDVIGFEILCRTWTVLLIVFAVTIEETSSGQYKNFDLVTGTLVYFKEIDNPQSFDGARNIIPPPSRNYERRSRLETDSSPRQTESHLYHHGKHYLKDGREREIGFVQREHSPDRNLPPNLRGRQGQQCRSRCFYIPDRDYCPTDIVEEIEADDYYDDDYSRENSIEYSEEYYSEEDYYDDDDEYYDDDEDFRRKAQGNRVRLTSSERRGGEDLERNQRRNRTSGGESEFCLVYPSLTRFAVSKGDKRGQHSERKGSSRNKVAARRRSRQRRLRLRQPRKLIRLRPSGLEQEVVVRWDRVVERGPYIGGDIVVPEGVLFRPPNLVFRRQWPDGVIPFEIDSSLNTCRMNAIFDAMDEIEEKTCITFVKREKERNYIDIRRAKFGCSSYVGMIGGAQHLNLSTGCFSKFTVTHELMHAIGFDHEQSRRDRDKYIEIDFDNVITEKESQFELNPSFRSSFPYDIRSIMHYSAFLFAKNKCEPTIYPVDEKVNLCDLGMGNGKGGLTDCDVAKVNRMYNCGRKYSKKCKVKR